ncbi:MAG: hypothetical protein J5770_04110 [Bacteroidaceae bacterium]|nr:hypothetical protein [Bacteroidaceae bacterium]
MPYLYGGNLSNGVSKPLLCSKEDNYHYEKDNHDCKKGYYNHKESNGYNQENDYYNHKENCS